MPSLQSLHLRLDVTDGSIRLIDRGRECAWSAPLDPNGIVTANGSSIIVAFPTHSYRWSLADDHAVVTLSVTGDPKRLPLSPAFSPIDHRPDAIIPQYQGALLRPASPSQSWSAEAVRGGHTNLSLGMLALTCPAGGLLLVPDRLVGWIARFGHDSGIPFAAYDAVPLEAEGWEDGTLRLYPTEPGVTAIALHYRRIVQSRGQFKSWAEKIDAKPILSRLFGSLFAFIGYVQDDSTDYVGNIRALRAMGFDSILAYPARFAHYTPFTMAGGHPPIQLTDAQIAAMQDAGALVAPWAWTFEGIDDGTDAMRSTFRHHASGPARGWSMDNQTWYHVCPPYQARHIKHRLDTDMRAMDWLHFDVNATHPATACWNTGHDLHAGHRLSLEQSIAETGRLLSPATVGNRIVSSEGFNDAYTDTYDIGSTKMVPHDAADHFAVPIPLTMLVYHDCCIHDWWELHNYNANPCWMLSPSQKHTGHSALGRAGSGEPHLKAALDALYGLPPNVFPFGMQYGWIDRPGGKTYPFRMSLTDAPVQEALRAALPVARLHGRIGQLPMTSLEFLDNTLLLQRTTFSDGTQVTANLSSTPRADFPAHSWRASEAGGKQ